MPIHQPHLKAIPETKMYVSGLEGTFFPRPTTYTMLKRILSCMLLSKVDTYPSFMYYKYKVPSNHMYPHIAFPTFSYDFTSDIIKFIFSLVI